ncbi:MAG: hypothetical protein ACK4NW_03235 [Roseinatronobacter sp.]
MGLVLDFVIAFSALLAAAYCLLLSRRLRAFTRLDGDVGKAIAVLSQQVDALTRALHAAEQSNARADTALEQQIARADATARKLELLMAAQHRAPAQTDPVQPAAERAEHGAEQFAPRDDFAPFGRSASAAGDIRSRVLRRREPVGAGR